MSFYDLLDVNFEVNGFFSINYFRFSLGIIGEHISLKSLKRYTNY